MTPQARWAGREGKGARGEARWAAREALGAALAGGADGGERLSACEELCAQMGRVRPAFADAAADADGDADAVGASAAPSTGTCARRILEMIAARPRYGWMVRRVEHRMRVFTRDGARPATRVEQPRAESALPFTQREAPLLERREQLERVKLRT